MPNITGIVTIIPNTVPIVVLAIPLHRRIGAYAS
jgi:hypothetical protein